MLGRLPLALELAGAYLGKFSSDVSLADYRSGLKADGALGDSRRRCAELSGADLRRVHDPAVAATIGEQWLTLQDEWAQLLLRVASLFPESAAMPIARLGLLAGLGDEARPGRPSPLRRTVRRLDDACLVERLEGDEVRIHPLIREFAARQTLPEQAEDFRRQCTARAATALEDFANLRGSGSPARGGWHAGGPDRHPRALSPIGRRCGCSTSGLSPIAPARGSQSAGRGLGNRADAVRPAGPEPSIHAGDTPVAIHRRAAG